MQNPLLFIILLIVKCNAEFQFKCWAESCTKPNSLMQNVKVNFYPNPPVEGQKITGELDGTIMEKVTSGRVFVKAFFKNFPPLKETYDFCYLLSYLDKMQCPLPAGDVHFNYSTFLKTSSILPGNYSGTATITNQMNDEVVCLKGGCEITG
ncbi:putative phosphatidylglycerol/phosphatidylinositol transfer protein DDB_G0282107 isoform X1 [Dysidea avara]|uniref:putative phosphatidylglycerol/phosphatidylinositol transfer protein DDB_G0282107 isoform X1 n=1 Tax=Dysidea avara TaxID=196820 RepID=UPI0033240591